MKELYVDRETIERARNRRDKAVEKCLAWFLWFVAGIIMGYAWFWVQGGGGE